MPSFYYRFRISAVMREMGFIHCTPDNITEYDEYDINAALLMNEIENDPQVKKAREHARKKAQSKPARKGRSTRKTGGQGNHLSVV